MPRSRNSFVLLTILAFLILFFGGFRLGAFVEHTNKTYAPPTPTPQYRPSPTLPKDPNPPMKFTFQACSTSFFLPDGYEVHKESSESALFKADSAQVLASCNKKRQLTAEKTGNLNATTLSIGGRSQRIYHESPTTDIWEAQKPGSNLFLSFSNPPALTELIVRTLVFETTQLQITPVITP